MKYESILLVAPRLYSGIALGDIALFHASKNSSLKSGSSERVLPTKTASASWLLMTFGPAAPDEARKSTIFPSLTSAPMLMVSLLMALALLMPIFL